MNSNSFILKKLIFNPIFLVGLVLRLTLILYVTPVAVMEWYVPFLAYTSTIFTIDPWSSWVSSGGNIGAFPYGYVMWVVFLPVTFISKYTGES